jgi:NADH:ubiquinone oxidoreductase subunit 2 (subunit N)
MTWSDTVYLLPEIIIAIGACVLLIVPVTRLRGQGTAAKWTMLAVLAITAASVVVCSNVVADIDDQTATFASMFALDGFAIFFKLLFIVTMAMLTLLSDDFLRGTR